MNPLSLTHCNLSNLAAMTTDMQPGSSGARQGNPQLTREALYELVWAQPMLKVGARFGVSSSYMARVCSALNVPRPERGYWAKLAFAKRRRSPRCPQPDFAPCGGIERRNSRMTPNDPLLILGDAGSGQ